MFSVLLLSFTIGWEKSEISTPPEFGKIFVRDSLLLVGEISKGIRFLTISNATTPLDLGLLTIPDNHDMAVAVSDNGAHIYLYADSKDDLLVFDITNPRQPRVLDTISNIFQTAYGSHWGDNAMPFVDDVEMGEGCACYIPAPQSPSDQPVRYDYVPSNGRSGSMARFAVLDSFLYCIDYNQLYVFEIISPETPRYVNKINVGWEIETLFPYQNYFFIGGRNGMYIYSRENPKNPVYISTYLHLRACDPVVVEDTIAYVTLRGNTRCGQVVSALHLLSISKLQQPKLIVSYPLPQPMGLDVSEKIAYVCDDSVGVFVLNTTMPDSIVELARIGSQRGYDAIKYGQMLIVSSRSNISFYNVSNPNVPVFVGKYGS